MAKVKARGSLHSHHPRSLRKTEALLLGSGEAPPAGCFPEPHLAVSSIACITFLQSFLQHLEFVLLCQVKLCSDISSYPFLIAFICGNIAQSIFVGRQF